MNNNLNDLKYLAGFKAMEKLGSLKNQIMSIPKVVDHPA